MNSDDKTILACQKSRPPNVSRKLLEAKKKHEDADKTVIKSRPQKKATQSDIDQSTQHIIKERLGLVRMIGSGGMGDVYKALDLRKIEADDNNPYIAVKVLNSDFRDHPSALMALQRESRKSQILAHPNILTVYDFDRDDDIVFMTMEYLEGDPLDQLLREQMGTGIDEKLAFNILMDITSALIYAHSHKIVHLDFKPGNIFVTRSGTTKVFDFGIAHTVKKNIPRRTKKDEFSPNSLGALTPAYASLEMLEGEKPDMRDDIYALGCVIYELFSGRHPFDRTPANQALKEEMKPKRLHNISRKQWGALERTLHFTRDKRTPNVENFRNEFFEKESNIKWDLIVAITIIMAFSSFYFLYQDINTPTTEENTLNTTRKTQTLNVETLVSNNKDQNQKRVDDDENLPDTKPE